MSNTCTTLAVAPEPPAPDAGARVPEREPSPEDLAAFVDHVRQAERHMATAVSLAGRLAGSGVCERVEGLPLDHFIGLAARLTGADRRMLVTAGEVLADLPATARLFSEGALSWGQVRAIVNGVKRLGRRQRKTLDARLAATAAARGGLDDFDPDGLVWAVDEAVEDLRGPRSAERSERRRSQASFVAVQAGFDGGLRLYGELDPVTGAGVLNALDAAAGRPTGAGDDDARDAAADSAERDPDRRPEGADGSGGWTPTGRGRQYARALWRICADWLGGDKDRPARPLFVSHVDVTQTAGHPCGVIELGVRGPLSRIAAATIDRLARDADFRAVLFDGACLLAASGKVSLADVPADIRFAVGARDRGCRFPGSQDPLSHTDVHHIVPRSRGGDHHPDRLVRLSRRYHTLVHRHDWTLILDPASGQLTARRRHRAWHSLPHGTRLHPAADHDDGPQPSLCHDPTHAGDRAPPGLPF